jgi:glutamate/tyrosine decarboxylase-like PLP-dependent enzyme
MSDRSALLQHTSRLATNYLETIGNRHVGATATADELRAALGGELSDNGEPAKQIIEALAQAAERGTIASQGPRYFGFVVGGSVPAATAADWLVSAWDQNAGVFVLSPLVAVTEDITAGWLKSLAGLPSFWSTGFVTGCQGANITGLAAARHHVLAAEGWDVGALGLPGAPAIDVVVSDESHYTIFNALRQLGLGSSRVRRVPTDDQGRMRADKLRETLSIGTGPCIVCAQAGNVNTGAFDPLEEIADASRARGAWLHVDGAFGLWAAASPSRAHLVRGIERADSVATDAHKWLNVPYDCGVVFTAHTASHRAAMTMGAAYIVETASERDPRDFVPEESRRGRAVTVYAALRSLGRQGVGALVDRCCGHATRLADQLRSEPGLEILNEVVLNQLLVRVKGEDPDALTKAMIARLQTEGTCWASGTSWHGMAAMRVSISNWSTTSEDIDRTADAIRRAYSKEPISTQPSGKT